MPILNLVNLSKRIDAFLSSFISFIENPTLMANANYQMLVTDRQVHTGVVFTAPRQATLPNVALAKGRTYVIKDALGTVTGTNTLTIVGTIEGATNLILNAAYASAKLYSNGTVWIKIP